MVLYNVTVVVEKDIQDEWISWMKQEHIPEVMATGYFFDYKFFKIMENGENEEISYAIQYFAKSLADLHYYMKNAAPNLQQKHKERYGEQCLAYRTVLKEV